MAAYLIINYQIDDHELYNEYRAAGPRAALRVGTESEIVVFETTSEQFEGVDAGPQTVMVRFESREKAREIYRSGEYQAIVGKRLAATSRHFAILVDSLDPG